MQRIVYDFTSWQTHLEKSFQLLHLLDFCLPHNLYLITEYSSLYLEIAALPKIEFNHAPVPFGFQNMIFWVTGSPCSLKTIQQGISTVDKKVI